MALTELSPSYTGEMTADQWKGQIVVAFGDARVDDSIPADKVWRVDNPAGEGLRALSDGLHPDKIKEGFAFVLPESLDANDAAAVVEIQKVLIYLFYKYVFFPRNSLSTADTLGVREEPLPDVIREINQLRNYPWLMSSPLTDKLSRERVGLPVMVILPGPSMHDVLPRLKEIRKHCLIACLARTINDCLGAGVVPDIVLQLDTYQIQRNFYERLPDMPETLLIPLSICPFYPYANKFRGVVMMDSFNMDLLPNPARLRESYVSSITAALGLAEALHSPAAFIAGANLSSPMQQGKHPYEGRSAGVLPLYPSDTAYLLTARDGSTIEALDYFIATAREVEQFASEIREATGTQFFSTTDATLLSPQWFPHAPIDSILGLPEIDRTAFLATVDTVLEQREEIGITKTRMRLLKELGEMRKIEQAFNGGGVPRDVLDDHILAKATRKMRNPGFGENVDSVGVAAKVSTKWRESLNNARLLVQAITNTERDKAIPLLCFEHEAAPLQTLLGRIIKGSKWTLYTIVTPPYAPFENALPVSVNGVLGWIATEQVVFASPGIMREFSYVMDYVPDDNVYDITNVVGLDNEGSK